MRRITIAGGGLAGLTLGILLRRRGVPVEIWEAYDYPRHRVCGEFISGDGCKLLAELLPDVRGHWARTVQFHSQKRRSTPLSLPEPALSISRWSLDHALARSFLNLGGHLRTRGRWTEGFEREGLVRASGRMLKANGRGWIGLKFHARDIDLRADLEMHFARAGYLGISRLPDGVNICALLRPGADVSGFRQDPLRVLAPVLGRENFARLQAGQIDEDSLCAITGISFRRHRQAGVCSVGDAMGMIPPFTGNGMSLAIESGFMAAQPLLEYAAGQIAWTEALKAIDQQLAHRFRRRFLTAKALRLLLNHRATQNVMLSSLKSVPRLLTLFFRCTR